MHLLGRIQQLQIQRASLKVMGANNGRQDYTPLPILRVPSLRLTPQGVIGIAADTTNYIDIHHQGHSHARRGIGISMGFSSHYHSMRAHFENPQLEDGIAGENIIVQTELAFPDGQLIGVPMAIQSAATGQVVELNVVKVIEPCEPFSRFCHQSDELPAARMKEALQFLHQGRRGYGLTLLPATAEVTIHEGDAVLFEGAF